MQVRSLLTGLLAVIVLAIPATAQTHLYASSSFQNAYFEIDTTTGAAISTQAVTLAGFTVTGINSLVSDPTTGTVYIIAKTSGNGRQLATLNLATGVATVVGSLGDNFSSLTFTSSGQLYGVTGDGATVPETLYTINKANASKTLFQTLGNGADGEVIAFNPTDGLIYHWSGNGTNIFESINLTSHAVTNIVQSGDSHAEIFGAVWNPAANRFYITDISSRLLTQTSAGVVTLLGTQGADDYRGLALVGTTNSTPVGTPTLSEWGMIALAGLLLAFAARKIQRA